MWTACGQQTNSGGTIELKRFRELAVTRLLAWPVVAALLISVLAPIVAVPAAAQSMQQVAVVDFTVRKGQGDASLTRSATDAVAMELSRNGFNVVPRSQVQSAMDDLALEVPLDKLGVTKLGARLGATTVITGEVVNVAVTGTPRRAAVTMIIRSADVASGEIVSGAAVTGHSNARVGYSGEDQELIREAVANGAFEASRTIASYNIPEATVLNTISTDEVLINRGARGGIQNGMEMVVLRGSSSEVVGRIRVQRVSDTDAIAKIISSTRGISPEDKCRAVFTAPEVRVAKGGQVKTVEPRVNPPSVFSSVGKALLIGALVYGAVTLAKGGNGSENAAVARVAARAIQPVNGQPRIEVTWAHGMFAQGANDRVRYYVYRNDTANVVQTANGNVTSYIDGDSLVVSDNNNNNNNTNNNNNNNDNNNNNIGSNAFPLLVPGQLYRYYVELEYNYTDTGTNNNNNNTNNNNNNTSTRRSDRVATGLVTALTWPADTSWVVSPAVGDESVDLNSVDFTFTAPVGANTYAVQVSTDPAFRTNVLELGPFVEVKSGNVTLRKQNLAQRFRNVPASQSLYWRVGARSSADSLTPKNNYVWTERIASFKATELPPPGP